MSAPAGRAVTGRVTVRVPATGANLGPGFDCLGLALDLCDEVVVTVADPGSGDAVEVEVTGEGAGEVPTDARHLVVRALHRALDALGAPHPPLTLHATNAIPHGRGLGSSAAAVVAGLLAGRALVPGGAARLDDLALLDLASAMEGHPDNAAACLLGGLTVAWQDSAGEGAQAGCGTPARVRALRLEPRADLRVTAFVPAAGLSTERARGLLPATVPLADAAHAAGRAALLVAVLTGVPGSGDLLLPATEDRLHQPYRAAGMAATAALVGSLRAAGRAAVVSGAGPTVLVLDLGDASGAPDDAVPTGWRHLPLDLAGGALVTLG